MKINEYLDHIAKVEYQFLPNQIGWQTVYYNKEGNALGGGVSKNKETSARIGLAEVAERKVFREILNNPELSSEFEMKNHPTTCGFAAGFEKEKTKWRSIAEALERWAWSKWIDEGYFLSLKENFEHTEISKSLSTEFEKEIVFHKTFTIEYPKKIELQFLVYLGIKANGIFPGSRVCSKNENAIEHAVVEAYRHLKIHEKESERSNFPYNRINFFAKNKDIGLGQIEKVQMSDWPKFSVKLLKEYKANVDDLYIYRCIGFDFIPWDQGSIDRFVY